jgi:hypothetical protein
MSPLMESVGYLHTSVWILENVRKVWYRVRGLKLTKQDVYFECSETPLGQSPYYKSKVRIVFTNHTNRYLIVSAPKWESALAPWGETTS